MKKLRVEYRPEAANDIEEIFLYIHQQSHEFEVAKQFVERLYNKCEKIGNVPHGGVSRDDLGIDIQLVPFEKTAIILYKIENNTVIIVNVFYGGRDYNVLMD